MKMRQVFGALVLLAFFCRVEVRGEDSPAANSKYSCEARFFGTTGGDILNEKCRKSQSVELTPGKPHQISDGSWNTFPEVGFEFACQIDEESHLLKAMIHDYPGGTRLDTLWLLKQKDQEIMIQRKLGYPSEKGNSLYTGTDLDDFLTRSLQEKNVSFDFTDSAELLSKAHQAQLLVPKVGTAMIDCSPIKEQSFSAEGKK